MGSEMQTLRRAPGGLWVTSGSLRPCVLFPDVNECSQESGSCSQICYNKPGSFQCGCYSGYTLSLDGRTCHGEALGPGCRPLSSSPIFFRDCQVAGWLKPQSLCSSARGCRPWLVPQALEAVGILQTQHMPGHVCGHGELPRHLHMG